MPAAGARVRDYEVWGRLSEGGMSEVWLAKHAVLGIPVVLKTLRGELHEDELRSHEREMGAAGDAPKSFDRMLNEARLMARIASPRVVRAIDAGIHDGTAYVVQEYVDGIDLAEIDGRRRGALGLGLPLWFVCLAMHELALGLQAAHLTGILHRDVKPSNIFGSSDNGMRLGDFGIAIPHREAMGATERSGTFRFMAPEQLRGEPLDRSTDVYGAGATAFDLRYGRPPFIDVMTTLDPLTLPAFPRPKSPSEASFQHIVGSMLTKDPTRRPRNLGILARQFLALSRALEPSIERRSFSTLDSCRLRMGDCEVVFEVGDIAKAHADGIVSSAHYHMQMRSGVGAALRQAGGDAIEAEALAGGERALGTCIDTTAGTLSARHVLHAVSAWNEVSCVARAAYRTFLRADELGLRTLAIPALGTGASRVSVEASALALATTLRHHLALGGSRLRHVRFVLYDEPTLRAFREVAIDALHAGHDELPALDLGLEVEGGVVVADAATHVQPSGT